MDLARFGYVPIAVLSGVSFGLLSIAYRLGQPRGVAPIHVGFVCALVGAAFFGAKAAAGAWTAPPGWMLLGAAGVAASQAVAMVLVKRALDRGALSPVACVLSMAFLPVSLYAWLAFGETISLWQGAAFLLAIGSIVAASRDVASPPASPLGSAPRPRGASLRYALLLLAMLLINSVSYGMIKELGTRAWDAAGGVTYLARFGDFYFLAFYLALAGFLACGVFRRTGAAFPVRTMVVLGLMGGLGSVGGMLGLSGCASGPAATVFTLTCISTVATVAVASALFFGEGRSLLWYATVLSAVLAVALTQVGLWLR